MDDVSSGEAAATVTFNWPAVVDHCRARGAETIADCATTVGVPLRTLDRLRTHPHRAQLATVLRIHMSTRIPLDDLVSVGGAVEREAA